VACAEGENNPMPETGGAAGSGGTSGSGAGGSAGAAGTSGTAGASGGGAGTSGAGGAGSATPTTVYDFNDSLEGFAITYYCLGPANSQNCSPAAGPPAPAADAGAGDAGAVTAPATDFYAVTHDPAVGDPAVGSAKVELNFTAGEQTAILALNYAVGVNVTGKTITARVLVDAGAPATTSAKLYIKTGAGFYYADRGAITLIAGTWLTLTYDTSLPPVYPMTTTAEYLLSDVRELGIELSATGIAAPAPAVVHIDTIQY
jgi:hypothetical protein